MKLLIAMAMVGCSSQDVEPTAPTDVEVSTDYSDGLYEPNRVLEVYIDIAEADAQSLSAETNDLFGLLLGEDCMDEPLGNSYNWYPAEASIDDGPLVSVGVRKKGLIGSLSEDKPGLKIDADRYLDQGRIAGVERLTLNNSISDPSYMKQCLGYDLFRAAGIEAPRCNFAHVVVGDDDLGLYVNVEPVKKPFLRWAYDGYDAGPIFEGTLSDFRAGWTNTFEPKTGNEDDSALLAVRDALEVADDDAMLAALEGVLDLDKFVTFWAVEVLVGHGDGFAGNTNNFFVHVPETTGLIEFLPWGIDAIFLDFEIFGSDTTTAVLNNSALTRRLWDIPEVRAQYLDRIRQLLDDVWDEAYLHGEMDRMTALTEPFVGDDPNREEHLEMLRGFVTDRRDHIESALNGALPEFDEPLRDELCLIETGTLRVDFDTTWGSLGSYDPFSEGTGQLSGQDADGPFDLFGSSVAGDDEGSTLIVGIAWSGLTELSQAVLIIPEGSLAAGTTPIDGMFILGLMLETDFAVGEEGDITGSIWDGELVLDALPLIDGDPVQGYFEGPLYSGGPF